MAQLCKGHASSTTRDSVTNDIRKTKPLQQSQRAPTSGDLRPLSSAAAEVPSSDTLITATTGISSTAGVAAACGFGASLMRLRTCVRRGRSQARLSHECSGNGIKIRDSQNKKCGKRGGSTITTVISRLLHSAYRALKVK